MRRPVRTSALRTRLVLPLFALAAFAPTATAQASCSPDVVGVAASDGAVQTSLTVCAPAWGRPSGTDTGRKTG